MTTFIVTITGHPDADPSDIESNLTFVHPDWDVTVTELNSRAIGARSPHRTLRTATDLGYCTPTTSAVS